MEKIFQVSEFNEFVSTYLRQVGEATVVGEISELKVSQDKWLYITIKDETAALPIFAVTFNISGWRSLEIGMKVQVTGVPGLHQKSGKFSFNASQITPAGEGALKLAFEKLRRQLEQEGLFDIARKREITEFPARIGLITAKNSEAYNDVIKILKARFGGIKIYFYPVQVQGRESSSSIVQAFTFFNTHAELNLDCLILTRGGGSLEDLQSFNDESVVRAVFGSKVPVICGVGHERDISLADLAADIRASTPSNAAELLVRHRDEYLQKINYFQKQLSQLVASWISLKNAKLRHLVSALDSATSGPSTHLQNLQNRLHNQFLTLQSLVTQKHQRQENLTRLLNSLSYHQTLKRGFTITQDASGKFLTSISQTSPGDKITTLLSDGRIISAISTLSHETTN